MILNHRLNILHRPKQVEPSKSSVENLDKEHEKEQERWKLKAIKLAEAEERVRRGNYAFPEDKERCKQEISQANQAAQQAKQEVARVSKAADKLWEKPALKGDFYDPDRPWTAPSNDIDEGEAAVARRRNDWRAAEHNKQAVLKHAIAAREKSATDQESVRQAVLKEESFWNYGAASDKWIPAERRVKPPSSHVLEQANRGAPFGAPGLAPSKAQLSSRGVEAPGQVAPTHGGKPPAQKQYPWSWDADPVQGSQKR